MMIIKIKENDLKELVSKDIISSDQSEKIWNHLIARDNTVAQFSLIHFLYFFGGVICILALTWFMTLGWEQYGGPGLTIISILYMFVFTRAANKLWENEQFRIPAGLIYTIAIAMTPMLVYGIQRWTGFWVVDKPVDRSYRDYHEWIEGSWILMSVATVIVGSIYLKLRAFPFLTMPIAVALFYITMDIVPLIHGTADYLAYSDLRKLYSMILGMVILVVAYLIDKKEKMDFSFWLYLFGVLAFWGGLTSMDSDKELGKFIYFLINMGLLFLSLFLYRRVLMVFGSLGVILYLFHLSSKVFKDSLLFPVVLIVIGLGVIFLGIKYQKNKSKIDSKFSELLPTFLKQYRPDERV